MQFKVKNLLSIELFLGFGIGFGAHTSLRLFPLFGFGELFVFLSTIYIFFKTPSSFFGAFPYRDLFFRFYLLFLFLIVSPLVTFSTYFFSDFNSLPIYLLSYILTFLLIFLFSDAIKFGLISINKFSFYATLAFILPLIIHLTSFDFNGRFFGFSLNPNQIAFYAFPLLFLLSLNHSRINIFLSVVLLFFGFISLSDAFYLGFIASIISYILMIIFFNRKLSFGVSILFSLLFLLIFLSFFHILFAPDYIQILSDMDEGFVRLNLVSNAFNVLMLSPIIGFGVGSFSGIDAPFENFEAHNTFLDLAVQFGLFFPIIFYLIFLYLIYTFILTRNFLSASILIGIFIFTFFHFPARHFIFWILFSLMFLNFSSPNFFKR